MTFWDGVGAGWGMTANGLSQAGSLLPREGELLYKVFLSDTNGDTVVDSNDAFPPIKLVGDYNPERHHGCRRGHRSSPRSMRSS